MATKDPMVWEAEQIMKQIAGPFDLPGLEEMECIHAPGEFVSVTAEIGPEADLPASYFTLLFKAAVNSGRSIYPVVKATKATGFAILCEKMIDFESEDAIEQLLDVRFADIP